MLYLATEPTSNVTGAIDLAFVDRWTISSSLLSLPLLFCVFCHMTLPPPPPRVDIKQYIGLPSAAAIFKIFHSCIQELMRV